MLLARSRRPRSKAIADLRDTDQVSESAPPPSSEAKRNPVAGGYANGLLPAEEAHHLSPRFMLLIGLIKAYDMARVRAQSHLGETDYLNLGAFIPFRLLESYDDLNTDL